MRLNAVCPTAAQIALESLDRLLRRSALQAGEGWRFTGFLLDERRHIDRLLFVTHSFPCNVPRVTTPDADQLAHILFRHVRFRPVSFAAPFALNRYALTAISSATALCI